MFPFKTCRKKLSEGRNMEKSGRSTKLQTGRKYAIITRTLELKTLASARVRLAVSFFLAFISALDAFHVIPTPMLASRRAATFNPTCLRRRRPMVSASIERREADEIPVVDEPDQGWGEDEKGEEGSGVVWSEGAQQGLQRFKHYYRAQRIVPDAEFDKLLGAMQESAPATFRLNARSQLGGEVLREVQRLEQAGDIEPLAALPGVAWKLSKQAGRSVKAFLEEQQNRGALCRQELVSLLPALVLLGGADEERGEERGVVLDLCASPGSKSTQILNMVSPGWMGSGGLLIANEYDRRRIPRLHYRLQKETESHRSIITSFDARFFPTLPGISPSRILADVPCSGDGMLRRRSAGWEHWSPTVGVHLFDTQLGILSHALRLLPPGGTLVYSTCTLDPIQNEAVVARALASGPPAGVRLERIPHMQGITMAPGIETWLVPDLKGGGFVDAGGGGRCGPPEGWEVGELSKCRRLHPQDNDAGGFFLALFRRDAKAPPRVARGGGGLEEGEGKRGRAERLRVVDEAGGGLWKGIEEFYGLGGQAFPIENLMWSTASENERRKKGRICMVSDEAGAWLRDSWHPSVANMPSVRRRLRHYGVSCFWQVKLGPGEELEAYPCAWTLCQEGVPLIGKYMTRRVITFDSLSDFLELVEQGSMGIDALLELAGSKLLLGLDTCLAHNNHGDGNTMLAPGGALAVWGNSGNHRMVSVACVVRPGGILEVSVRRQELEGIITLLKLETRLK